MVKKSKSIILSGILTTLAMAYLFGSFAEAKISAHSTFKQSTPKEKLDAYVKFTQILNLIESQYVDEINISTLVDKALKGLMANLDAHSAFMKPKAYDNLSVQTKGEFGGLGISIGMRDGALTIIAPIDGTPAFRAGVKAGDIILKIDSQSTIGMSIDDSVKLMRGKPKTSITLMIIRKKEPKPLSIKIIRDIIKIQSVYSKSIGKDILYLHITSFDRKVVSDLQKAVSEHNNTKGIVLDLRNNPGGLLDQAVGVVDMFVDKGIIVSQKGRNAKETLDYVATKANTDKETPMVVLVNGGSASASEIVSGALQDFNRSIIIGEKTFGKGSVQVVVPLEKKEAIKLTIARYYLPSGRTIQAVGVIPDIVSHLTKVEEIEDPILLKERDLKAHLKEELKKIDTIESNLTKPSDTNTTLAEDNNSTINKKIITKKQLHKDSQLKSAVDILKALIITTTRRR